MPALYLYVLDTLADWEPGHLIAELGSGRYLKNPGQKYKIIPCGRTMDAITTMGGIRIAPEVLVSDIRPEIGDILVLPGADTWLEAAQEPVVEKAGELLDQGTVVAAICGATLGLANAGLLDNRPHTSNDPAALKMFCPHYRGDRYYLNDPAVTDGNLITASGLAPLAFAYHVIRKLEVMSPATLEAWHGLFSTRNPACFYALMDSLRTRMP